MLSTNAVKDERCGAFESVELSSDGQISDHMPLCQHHYHIVYYILHWRQANQCAACQMHLRPQKNHRPCVQPKVIEKHLQDNTGFEGEIHTDDSLASDHTS